MVIGRTGKIRRGDKINRTLNLYFILHNIYVLHKNRIEIFVH